MKKLLIAEHSEVLANNLEKTLQDEWEIHTCADGYTTIDTLQYLQPEAMVIDLRLPQKTGLSVLEECFPRIPPVTMALSTYISPYVEQTAASLGVGYIMPLPCDMDELKERLADMYESYRNPPNATSRHLRSLGFNTKIDGYCYLLAAIPYFTKNRDQRMLKELYPDVAKMCDANNKNCVERSIRFAIQDAWERRDLKVWSYYFPLNEDGDIDCPSNKVFITRLAELI